MLKGEATLEMRADSGLKPRRDRPAPQALVAEGDEGLLSALKAKRRALAEAQKVPAYVVFPDRTLIEMATRKPDSLRAMAEIPGVGAKKLDRYGAAFLEVLTDAPVAPPHPARHRLDGDGKALFDALETAARDLVQR